MFSLRVLSPLPKKFASVLKDGKKTDVLNDGPELSKKFMLY